MKHTKFVALDIETTGLDPAVHEVIEVGCILFCFDAKKKVFRIEESFDIKIKPEQIELANPISLKVNGYTIDKWTQAVSATVALKTISRKIKGRVMVGHNAGFDYSFMNQAFKKHMIVNTLHYHVLDTLSMAYVTLRDNVDATRLSLQYLCDFYGIENKKAHTALADAQATYELFVKLMEK
jgi:DNA polymerase III epsilon subunit family exonuclease